jgi:serine/threonine protein kinase
MQRFKDGTKLGSYTIVRLVGRGGMGEVYEAYEHTLDRRVALKVISPQKPGSKSENEMIDRFMREARTLAQVNHPNVVTIYAIDQIENTQFIAMEYVEGAQLSELFSLFAFTADEATPLFFQLLKGMSALHDRNIIHRDIKPHNLMLRPDGQIKILDFGIAKRMGDEDEADRAKKLVGTMAYLPPEVIHGSRADKRSDLWSLGAIFYEAVVGQTLVGLDGEKIKGAKAYPESGVVLPLESLKRIPHDMRMIISKLCEPNPLMRYESAQQAMEDLKIYQKNRKALDPLFFKALARIVENIGQVKVNADFTQLKDGKGKRAFADAIFTLENSSVNVDESASVIRPFTETLTQDNLFEVTRDSITARQKVRKKLSRNRKMKSWKPIFATLLLLTMIGGPSYYLYNNPKYLDQGKKQFNAFMAPNPEALKPLLVKKEIPTLVSPSQGTTLWLAATQVPTLTWSTVIPSGEYELQISAEKDFSTLLVREPVAGNSFRPAQALTEGTYYWRLSPIADTKIIGPAEFSVGSLSPVKAIDPTAGQVFEMLRSETTAEVELAWKCKRFVQSYRVQISLQASFNNPLHDEVVSECGMRMARYPKGTYFWRVRSVEPSQAKNNWNAVSSFIVKQAKPTIKMASVPAPKPVKKVISERTVAALAPPPAEKVSPIEKTQIEKPLPGAEANKPAPQLLDAIQIFTLKFTDFVKTAQNAIQGKPQPAEFPLFRWMEVEGAKAYKFEISRSADFSKIIEQKTVTGAAQFEWKQVVPEQLFWRVAAIVDGEGPYSKVGKLDVRLPAPSWGSAYSYTVKDQAFLEWEPVPYAEYYIVQWSPNQEMASPSEKVTAEVKAPLDLNGGQLYVRIAVANKYGHRISEFSNVARIRASTKSP